MWYPVDGHLRKHHLQHNKYLKGWEYWECSLRRLSETVNLYLKVILMEWCPSGWILCIWRLEIIYHFYILCSLESEELTGVLVLFCERVKLFLSLLFLNLLNATASVSVHLVISVLLCLHLTEEITISVNSETEMLL